MHTETNLTERVTVKATPPAHGKDDKGKQIMPCTCKGRRGVVVSRYAEGTELYAIVRFDGGGRAGIPMSCLRVEELVELKV